MNTAAPSVRLRGLSLLIGVLGIAGALTCANVLPAFGKVYSDLGETLPLLTWFLLGLRPWGWPFLGLVWAAALWCKDSRLSPAAADRLNAAALFGLLLAALLVVVALFLPLIVDIKSVK
ncbi:MAG: hypothetical protein HZA54_10560 [Planctomycetes bacterium]|nr:hypothetical protein [Planctomycetota bacterium]